MLVDRRSLVELAWRSFACGLLLFGCEAKQPSTPSNPEIDRLQACARELAAIESAAPPDRARLIAAHLQSGQACFSFVHAGCDLEPLDPRATATKQIDQRRLCVERVCPDLHPRPRLCDDPDVDTANTEAEVIGLLADFLAAKLADQLALPRDDARVLEVARAYARIWAAPILMSRVHVSPPRSAD